MKVVLEAIDSRRERQPLDIIEDQWVLRNFREGAEAAQWLYDRLVLDGPATLGPNRLYAVLSLAGRASYALPENRAEEVLRKCTLLTGKDVDPYADSSLIRAARSAMAEVLSRRPELDDFFLQLVDRNSGTFAVYLEIMAAALRDRSLDGGRALIKAAERWALGPDEAARLAEKADSTLIREPKRHRLASGGRFSFRAVSAGLTVGPIVVTVLLVLGFSRLANSYLDRSPSVLLEPAGALAVLALVVTANIFVVQLSSNRLPGVVARSVGQLWQLRACYAAVLLMTFFVFRAPVDRLALQFGQWAALISFGIVVVSLLTALPTMLGRTDEGRAARAFARSKLAKHRSAGARYGSLQFRVGEVSEAIKGMAEVRASNSEVPGERSDAILAARRGIFLPQPRSIARMLRESPFRDGANVRFTVSFGNIVANGQPLAGIIPGVDQVIPRAVIRRAGRSLKVKNSSQFESAASAIVSLLSLCLKLNEAGDTGTAMIAGESSIRLLDDHVASARRNRLNATARRWHHGNVDRARRSEVFGSAAMIPAVRDVVLILVEARLNISDQREFVVDRLIDLLLGCTGRADWAAASIRGTLPGDPTAVKCGPASVANLGRRLAVWALENEDPQMLDMAVLYLENHLDSSSRNDPFLSSVVEVVAISVRFDKRTASKLLKRLIASLKNGEKKTVMAHCLWQVGAAAIAHGAYSVADRVRQAAQELECSEYIVALSNLDGIAQLSSTRAQMFGSYLGDSGVDALMNFANYVRRLNQVAGSDA